MAPAVLNRRQGQEEGIKKKKKKNREVNLVCCPRGQSQKHLGSPQNSQLPEEGLVQSRPGPERRGAPQPAPTLPPFLRPASSLYSMSAVSISLSSFHCPEVSLQSPRPEILCFQCSSHFQRTVIQNSFLQPLLWSGVEKF